MVSNLFHAMSCPKDQITCYSLSFLLERGRRKEVWIFCFHYLLLPVHTTIYPFLIYINDSCHLMLFILQSIINAFLLVFLYFFQLIQQFCYLPLLPLTLVSYHHQFILCRFLSVCSYITPGTHSEMLQSTIHHFCHNNNPRQFLQKMVMCNSRKYPYPPYGRLMEIPRGRGVSKAQFFEWKYDTKMEFPEGFGVGGGFNLKNLPWEAYGYFVHNTIQVCEKLHRSVAVPVS